MAEDGSSRSRRAPDLATLSEGICHRSLHPTPLQDPRHAGTRSTPAPTEPGSCKEVTYRDVPKNRDLKINRTKASLQ